MAQQQPSNTSDNTSFPPASRSNNSKHTNNTIKSNEVVRAVRATSYMHQFNKNHGRMGQQSNGFKKLYPSRLSPSMRHDNCHHQNIQNMEKQSISKTNYNFTNRVITVEENNIYNQPINNQS
eukprot:810854_1